MGSPARSRFSRLLVLAAIWFFVSSGKAESIDIEPTLINSIPVKTGTWKEIVYIRSTGGFCTATLIGPKVLITAAHCATTGSTVTFSVDGKSYSAKMTRSALYPRTDHDINVGIINQVIPGMNPKTVGGTATKGLGIALFGYGCTDSQGNGGNDGILRTGSSVVTGFSNLDMVSSTRGGAALCFGDSGGPAFIADNGEDGALLLGINSKGNIRDTNYNARLDIKQSQDFLSNFAKTNSVDICGINGFTCGGTSPGAAASCVLTANPQTINLGESVTLSLAATNATSATIDGVATTVPTGSRIVKPSAAGIQMSVANVVGAGAPGECRASYTVVDNTTPPPASRPTCVLSAVPQQVNVGSTVSLELTVQGQADYASIDGIKVTVPSGKRLVTATAVGDFSSNGFVRGSGGSSNCFADYTVVNTGVPPVTPSYAVTPALCGANTLPQSGVKSVCIGVIKKSDASEILKIQNVILVNNSDGTTEVLPQLSSKVGLADATTGNVDETWTLYTNKTVPSQNFQVLDTKAITATKNSNGVYVSLEGRSAAGKYFLVTTLAP